MSFVSKIFEAIGSIFSGPSQPQPQPIMQPSPAPPVPARSDAEVREMSSAQRRKYALGSTATNLLTGGSGVSTSSTYSAVTSLLGGGNATG